MLSEQRSDLAQKLISTQESTCGYISRELHDEFGQILTAIGSMLRRAEKTSASGYSKHDGLPEVREVTQNTLDRSAACPRHCIRIMLDELGLESTLDWYYPL